MELLQINKCLTTQTVALLGSKDEQVFLFLLCKLCTYTFIMHRLIFQRYLVAAIGSGFCVYDCETGQTVLKKQHAHHSKINDLCFTCDGLVL